MLGDGPWIVNSIPLLPTLPVVTTTRPLVAPEGTEVAIEVSVQLVTIALIPLKVTMPEVDPKFVPTTVTAAPTAPDAGDKLVIVGADDVFTTVKVIPLLAFPFVVTTTFPDVALSGTVVSIAVSVQLITVAFVPLNVTDPDAEPKFVPVMVTAAPIAPEFGDKPVMLGVEDDVTTVNPTRLLPVPLTVTATLPVEAPVGTFVAIEVSDQLVVLAAVPLKVTIPAVEPKLLPVMMTEAPTAPEFGERLVILGPVGGGGVLSLFEELTPAQPQSRSKRMKAANCTRTVATEQKGVFFLVMGTRSNTNSALLTYRDSFAVEGVTRADHKRVCTNSVLVVALPTVRRTITFVHEAARINRATQVKGRDVSGNFPQVDRSSTRD